jgi:hypothetical protein
VSLRRWRYRARWRVALLLNRHPATCYHQLASWAHYGPEPEGRLWNCQPTLSCRIDAGNHGCCWCTKRTADDLGVETHVAVPDGR